MSKEIEGQKGELRMRKIFKRFDIKKILLDPILRKDLIVNSIIFIQGIEGVDTSKEQAERSYLVIREIEND